MDSNQVNDVIDVGHGGKCVVCWELIGHGDLVAVLLCGHFFCHECSQSLGRAGVHGCPLCREDMCVQFICKAQKYYPGSGQEEDPIIID